VPDVVHDTVVAYLDFERRIGGYEAMAAYADKLSHVKTQLADLIGAAPEEVALAESQTVAWNRLFWGLQFKKGDIILTATASYGSNFLAFMQARDHFGAEIQVVPSTPYGEIDLDALKAAITPRVKLIALTHIPTFGGLVNPAEEVGQIARQAGIPYLLDACQSIGQYPLDVEKLGCDMMTGTGRKYLRAPRGTGFAYVRKDFLDQLEPLGPDLLSADWLESGSEYQLKPDASRFEYFEHSRALKLGFGEACAYAHRVGMDRIWGRICTLSASLRAQLQALPKVELKDQGQGHQSGIVTFTVKDRTPGEVQAHLAAFKINISLAGAFAARLDMGPRGIEWMLRASVHYMNTEEEVLELVERVGEL
ncbi:MAG: aminotransferase class V-fold PLP-dependent enzyme, partial [Bacteroidota bacterium]